MESNIITENKIYDKTKNVLLINSIAKILSSMLYGVIDATNKYMAYNSNNGNNCQKTGQVSIGNVTNASATASATANVAYKGGAPNIIVEENAENIIGQEPDSSLAIGLVEKGASYLFKTIGLMSDSVAPVLENMIFGDLANKPWSEVAPNLNRIIKEKTEYLDKIAEDPELQQALREWAEAYTNAGIEVMDILQPSIERLIDEGIIMLEKAGSKAVSGVINTGLNIGEAALGEIPVAGGIIALIMAFIRGFNQAMLSAAPLVKYGTESVGTVVQNVNDAWSVIERSKERLDAINEKISTLQAMPKQVMSKFEESGRKFGESALQNIVTNPIKQQTQKIQSNIDKTLTNVTKAMPVPAVRVPVPAVPAVPAMPKPIAETQLGGKKIKNTKQLFKRINKTAKRIQSSIRGFTNGKQSKHKKTKKRANRK
jgi:hypothetical protein